MSSIGLMGCEDHPTVPPSEGRDAGRCCVYALILIFSVAIAVMANNAFYSRRIPPKPFGD
jgi:hypothetical protein